MDSQGTDFAFDLAMDFNFGASFAPQQQSFMKPAEGNTDAFLFAGDEGIDTTGNLDQSFGANMAGFDMQQNLTMDNTLGMSSVWDNQLSPSINDFAPQSFDGLYQQPLTNLNNKRPLSLDTQDFPQPKRHEGSEYSFSSPYVTAASSLASSSWALDTTTPSSSTEIGLSEEAADVCSMWFSKYNMLPSDRHIESLCQLTGESATAIRHWFGQILKQGMAGHDSAYKSQTSFSQPDQSFTGDNACNQETAASTTSPQPLRGGKKGCTPTTDPGLLRRDPSKIYQCTRKCGKRYGRKCDWKRNEEEGYPSKSWQCSLCASQGTERVKPCFRRYHFSQHFRNIHPGIDSTDYEESSLVHSETAFPRKCGFCTHRFVSRQDRIDHIADHFKQGKCMLDWNDDEDDNNDSDNADDDDYDDKHDSDSFNDTSGSSSGPSNKQTPPGSNNHGSGSGGGSGGGAYYGSYIQFQIPQYNAGGDSSESSTTNQHVTPITADKTIPSPVGPREEGSVEDQHSMHGGASRQEEPARVDEKALARDVVPRPIVASDVLQVLRSQKDDLTELRSLFSVEASSPPLSSGDLRLQTKHDQRLGQQQVDGTVDCTAGPEVFSDASPIDLPTAEASLPAENIQPIGRVAASIKESFDEGVPLSPLPPSCTPVLPPDRSVFECSFWFLSCSFTSTDQKEWRTHCLSHFSPEEPPTLVTGDILGSDIELEEDTARGGIHSTTTSGKDNDRQTLTHFKFGPNEHKEILTLYKTLIGNVDGELLSSIPTSVVPAIFRGLGLLAVIAGLPHILASPAWHTVESFLRYIRRCHFQLAAKDFHVLMDRHGLSRIGPLVSQDRELLEALQAIGNVLSTNGRNDAICAAKWTVLTNLDMPSSKPNEGSRDDSLTISGLSQQVTGLNTAESVFQAFARLSMMNGSDQLLERLICAQLKLPDEPWHSADNAYAANLWDILLEDHNVAGIGQLYDIVQHPASPPLREGLSGGNNHDSSPQLSTSSVLGFDNHPVNTAILSTNHVREINAPALGFHLQAQSFLSIKLLGAGGFSTVDEVMHRETNLRVSRKTLKNREHSALEELKKEVSVLQKLRHPHIIRFLGVYSKEDKVSILLSPVAETTLAVWLDECLVGKPAGLADTVVKMFGCLASSIRYLHEQRPVVKHMDIKPQNILVMYGDRNIPHVILSDFGISSSEGLNQEQGSKPLTRQYIAPEALLGVSREQAADIWSLGCVFLEMLTVGLSESNPQWLDFRKEFSGREAKYYWQEVPRLQEWLSHFLDQATSDTEMTTLSTVKSMLNGEPTERPDAAMLTMIFTPAPCCVSWPNEKTFFPGPTEEFDQVEVLLGEDADCLTQLHACGGSNCKPELEPFVRAKHWLQECSRDHEACHRQESDGKQLPTRLVDVRPEEIEGSMVRVVNSIDVKPILDTIDYVTISHVWSPSELTLSTDRFSSMQRGIPRKELSKAVNDALSAASRIGHRYVWIDSLCVLQDSDEDKQRECEAMASIFRDAALTIVTENANGNEASQTVHATTTTSTSTMPPPSSIDNRAVKPINWQATGFAWDTRAWTLQERLLCGRLLHLTGEQMYWECNMLKASETFPHGLPSLVWEKVHTRPVSTSSVSTRSLRTLTPPPMIPGPLRSQQFLKKRGDGVGDQTVAQTQSALKSHPDTCKVGDDEKKFNAAGINYYFHGSFRKPRTIFAKHDSKSRIGFDSTNKFDFNFDFPHTHLGAFGLSNMLGATGQATNKWSDNDKMEIDAEEATTLCGSQMSGAVSTKLGLPARSFDDKKYALDSRANRGMKTDDDDANSHFKGFTDNFYEDGRHMDVDEEVKV